ncbi:hypothetical protein CLOM_g16749 [Closterium sp. NIES-68]|nr:hypothetical protein CLOM_g16749 [Closterium sp. NIES-68]GJP71975.1 hypothetical protein CLOP_g2755 [Closterium sp. NIES-67]GJP73214.1 hypothetical protein CLOP_g3953 [Closterium sp. NIES-67]
MSSGPRDSQRHHLLGASASDWELILKAGRMAEHNSMSRRQDVGSPTVLSNHVAGSNRGRKLDSLSNEPFTSKPRHYVSELNRSRELDSDEEEPIRDMEDVLWLTQRRRVLGTRHGTPCSFPRDRIHRRSTGSVVETTKSLTVQLTSFEDPWSPSLSRSCPAAGAHTSRPWQPGMPAMGERGLLSAGDAAEMAPAGVLFPGMASSGETLRGQRAAADREWNNHRRQNQQVFRRHSVDSGSGAINASSNSHGSTRDLSHVTTTGRSMSNLSCSFPGSYRRQASRNTTTISTPSLVTQRHAVRVDGPREVLVNNRGMFGPSPVSTRQHVMVVQSQPRMAQGAHSGAAVANVGSKHTGGIATR